MYLLENPSILDLCGLAVQESFSVGCNQFSLA
jgi:hypothetical protein